MSGHNRDPATHRFMPGKVTFDPEIHCGAKNGKGEPCCIVKGWGLPEERKQANFARGNFRCYYHGGRSTGFKTQKGRERVRQSAKKSGFYETVLTGEDKVNMEASKRHLPPDLLLESFHLIHARLRKIVEGNGNFTKAQKTVIQACEVLMENGEDGVDEAFIADLKARMLGFDVGRLAAVMQTSANLITSVENLKQLGDIKVENKILKEFLLWAGQYGDVETKQMFLQTITNLKLQAGLPQDEIALYLRQVQGEAALASEEEVEGDGEAIEVEVVEDAVAEQEAADEPES